MAQRLLGDVRRTALTARRWPDALLHRTLPAVPDAVTEAHLQAFRHDLLAWFQPHLRAMPWRQTDDPYRIWLSETMLQQTRVDQARPYYERFTAAFPTVEALAEAHLDDVLRLWEGLGYYARARRLHQAAQVVAEEHGGVVPSGYDAFRDLPGVGPYTAAAVLSIAFDAPHGVLDGNVIRVLSRVFLVEDEVDRAPTKRRLQTLSDRLVDPERPGDWNQALMELGATVCTPTSPRCPACPLRTVCAARADGRQEELPRKKPRKKVPHHEIAVGVVYDEAGRVLVQRRPEDAMLGGLWEFPGGKQEADEDLAATCRRELREELGIEVDVEGKLLQLRHAYSHFTIRMHAFRCRLVEGTPSPAEGQPLAWVAVHDLGDYAFPRANRRLIEHLQEAERAPSLF